MLSIENIIVESDNKSAKQRINQGLQIVNKAKSENSRDAFKLGVDLLKEGLREILQELAVQGGDVEK